MSPSSILRRISARDCTDYLAVDFDAGSLITCTFHGALRSLVRYLVVSWFGHLSRGANGQRHFVRFLLRQRLFFEV